MLNVTKNDVEIDIFLEPKYHLDPNQVHSRSFLPSKNQINQKKLISGRLKIFDFQSGALKIHVCLVNDKVGGSGVSRGKWGE